MATRLTAAPSLRHARGRRLGQRRRRRFWGELRGQQVVAHVVDDASGVVVEQRHDCVGAVRDRVDDALDLPDEAIVRDGGARDHASVDAVREAVGPVSYTHLTLPTIYSV